MNLGKFIGGRERVGKHSRLLFILGKIPTTTKAFLAVRMLSRRRNATTEHDVVALLILFIYLLYEIYFLFFSIFPGVIEGPQFLETVFDNFFVIQKRKPSDFGSEEEETTLMKKGY